MKNHRIQSVTQKRGSELSSQAIAIAVAETMKGAVKSIMTESMFSDLPEYGARHLYFGRSQPGSTLILFSQSLSRWL